jgi:hypothetical protein
METTAPENGTGHRQLPIGDRRRSTNCPGQPRLDCPSPIVKKRLGRFRHERWLFLSSLLWAAAARLSAPWGVCSWTFLSVRRSLRTGGSRGSISPVPTVVYGEMLDFREVDPQPNPKSPERKGALARPNKCKTCAGDVDLGLKILLPSPNISQS